MRTHHVFYVGLLKPYQDPAQVSVEVLAPSQQEEAEPQAAGRQRIKLTLQLSNLTIKVDDPVLKGTRCLEPVHPTVHLFEISRQAGV
ncbi:hypothetical protein PC129_g25176 [Phytophthora cactorum]|uniref:Uncharacterized protein n=1 Tax=Phytophthora cactorum TaxID=29920 RepID=A0A8T1GSY7_9STRA|nr:hypothetical protein PC129_g25176 [Phytophthora cactorum]